MKLNEGDAVRAPDCNGVMRDGVVKDILSVQIYIEWEDGTGAFFFNDQIREIEKIGDAS